MKSSFVNSIIEFEALKDLYLSLQAHVLLAVSVDLDLQLDGVFVKLLLLLDVVAIRSLHFNLNGV